MNRIVSFLAGGLVVFGVMSLTVVDTAKKKNTELTMMLDVSRYEASRLISDAKSQFENRDYVKAKESLDLLFQNQPGSTEAVEGKKLYAVIDSAEKSVEAKWEAALAGIQKKWSDDRTAELRMESEKARTQMEKDMNDKISREWDDAKAKIRKEWLKTVRL
jgi:hypothetical protein